MFDALLSPAVQGHPYSETFEWRDEATNALISATVLNALAYTVQAKRGRDGDDIFATGSAAVEGDGLLTITLPASAFEDNARGGVRLTLDYSGDTGSGQTSGRLLDAIIPVVPR